MILTAKTLLFLLALSTNVFADSLDHLITNNNSQNDIPKLNQKIQYENKWCSYQDQIPYVKSVKWNEPLIKLVLKNLTPGHYSTISYNEWRKPYNLESDKKGSEKDKAIAKARNFIRVLCGELRDHPQMIESKLNLLANHQYYPASGDMVITKEDLDKNLFAKMTFPAYVKMKQIMHDVYQHRKVQAYLNALDTHYIQPDGYDYGLQQKNTASKRQEQSIAPLSQCEFKFMLVHYLSQKNKFFEVKQYELELAQWVNQNNCNQEDHEYYFNFRGHKNFKPLWFESNAFIWNSRRARSAEINRKDNSYYKRPFASRYTRSRLAWASYLNFPEHQKNLLAQSSKQGGGPIMYITDQDKNQDGLADYKLFPEMGCGDVGIGTHSNKCNKVDAAHAYQFPTTTKGSSSWSLANFWKKDFNFLASYPTFEERMIRLNIALDRHTNWGPTHYWMIEASAEKAKPKQVKMMSAYSPIVAASYDLKASHSFAVSDFPSTDPFEKGKTKWMFIMRIKKSHYYDEQKLYQGKPMNFDTDYFNETSLSNDYWFERALDKFGWIPEEDIYANLYLVYGEANKAPLFYDVQAPLKK